MPEPTILTLDWWWSQTLFAEMAPSPSSSKKPTKQTIFYVFVFVFFFWIFFSFFLTFPAAFFLLHLHPSHHSVRGSTFGEKLIPVLLKNKTLTKVKCVMLCVMRDVWCVWWCARVWWCKRVCVCVCMCVFIVGKKRKKKCKIEKMIEGEKGSVFVCVCVCVCMCVCLLKKLGSKSERIEDRKNR